MSTTIMGRRVALLLSAAWLSAACADGVAPGSTGVTVEEALAELSASGGSGWALAGFALGDGIVAGTCEYDDGTQFFACPILDLGDFTLERSFQLLGADGSPMAPDDEGAVHAIRARASRNGTRAIEGHPDFTSVSLDAEDDHVVSGLSSNTRTLNGTGTSVNLFTGSSARTVSMTRTLSGLVMPSHPTPTSYPAAGSLTTVTNADGGTTTHTMTFDGTSVVQITVATADGSLRTCTQDLSTPGAPPVCN